MIIIKPVSVPYEITLLSNQVGDWMIDVSVSVPYEITLLSNLLAETKADTIVSVPYEITLLSNHNRRGQKRPHSFSTL